MHQIEYKAAKIEAEKLQMANESRRVYEDYLFALDKKKIQSKILRTDGSIDFEDATYNILVNQGYKLSVSGALAVSQADIDFFNYDADMNAKEFAALKTGYAQKNGDKITLSSDPSKTLAFTATQLRSAVSAREDIVLMDNISVSGSMGTLSSTLDGNGYSISVNGSSGIFSTINGATVKNLNIGGNVHSNSSYSGLLANLATGTNNIENVSVSGSVSGTCSGGGLIGQSNQGSLTVNNVSLNVYLDNTGLNRMGGILGSGNNTNISVSNVSGTVKSSSGCTGHLGGIVGGLWGDNSISNISNCSLDVDFSLDNTGNSNSSVAGGIVGMGWDSIHIDSCYVTGSISNSGGSGYSTAGGIVGGWGAAAAKGNGYASIKNCYADVEIEVTTTNSQKGSYETQGDIAGLIWNADGQHIISNCASSNGTSQGNLIVSSNSRLSFTASSDASSVESQVQSATSGAGAITRENYDPSTDPAYQAFYDIGHAIETGDYFLLDGHEDDNTWLTNMINEGIIILSKPDNDGEYFDTSVAVDTNLQEVEDKSLLRKAEAKYESDMKRIDLKDRKFDYDLAALDNERNAIKQEIETLKTVAKDNVERTFKLFS